MFTILIAIFINFVISVPSIWISRWISRYHGSNYLWYNLSRIVIFAFLFLLLHKFVRKRYILLQDEIEKGWGIYSILPLIGSIALYYEYLQYSRKGDFSDVIIECILAIIIMAVIFIIFYYVFDQLHEKYLVQEQKRILDMQNKAQRSQFEQQREAAEKSNRRWHDLHHNIQELIELLEAGDTQMAITYLIEQRGVDVVPKEEFCIHTAVNSILCLWAERCRKAGISVEIHADVPEKLDIEPMELSALFANLFENAYEGCLRLPLGAAKFIKADAQYNGKRLAVGFTNSCIAGIRFEGDMPVSEKAGGGIGTRSIAYTIQRFQGTKYFAAENGIFTARFVLYI
jgi:signal transduction histidine kinase